MYCGSRRIAAMISAQVSSAGATGEPTPSATAMPSRVQASMSMCEPTRPVCEISFRLGQLLQQLRAGTGVRSRISTSTSASRRRTESWPMPLTVLVKTLALSGSSSAAHLQLAHGVLVVVEDDDVHGLARPGHAFCRVQRGLRGGASIRDPMISRRYP